MQSDHYILGLHVTERLKDFAEVQRVFADFGRNTKTRLGLHEIDEAGGPSQGLVLLEIIGGVEVGQAMKARFQAIEGLEVQDMIFRH